MSIPGASGACPPGSLAPSMTAAEFFQPWSAERLRHVVFGPYDYERKLEGGPRDELESPRGAGRRHRSERSPE